MYVMSSLTHFVDVDHNLEKKGKEEKKSIFTNPQTKTIGVARGVFFLFPAGTKSSKKLKKKVEDRRHKYN